MLVNEQADGIQTRGGVPHRSAQLTHPAIRPRELFRQRQQPDALLFQFFHVLPLRLKLITGVITRINR